MLFHMASDIRWQWVNIRPHLVADLSHPLVETLHGTEQRTGRRLGNSRLNSPPPRKLCPSSRGQLSLVTCFESPVQDGAPVTSAVTNHDFIALLTSGP